MTAAPTEISSESYDDLGLNIVFSEPATTGLGTDDSNGGAAGRSSKTPKRKNKYDRRREKSRQAKLAKLSGNNEILGNNTLPNPKSASKNSKQIDGKHGLPVGGSKIEICRLEDDASKVKEPRMEEEKIANIRNNKITNGTQVEIDVANNGKNESNHSAGHTKQFSSEKQLVKPGDVANNDNVDRGVQKSSLAAVADSFSRRSRVSNTDVVFFSFGFVCPN